MKGKWVLIILGILAVFAIVSIAGNAKTIYVGPSEKYTSIQSAIDNATDGDTIIVRDGVYYENIKVTKRLTIKSENGSDNCIIDGGDRNRGNVITLKADGITIEGFTVRKSGRGSGFAGIKVLSNSNNIRYNNISNNGGNGIFLYASSSNNITHNHISNNYIDGINLFESSNNAIAFNSISNNDGDGMWLDASSNNKITYNNISNNGNGILLVFSYSNSIRRNNFIDNGWRWQVIFFDSFWNHWIRNYWDDWRIPLPRPILGIITISGSPVGFSAIPWVNFDWFPAIRPYSIE